MRRLSLYCKGSIHDARRVRQIPAHQGRCRHGSTQPRNDVLSWQNRSGNGATGRTTEIPATKAESVDVQEQDRLGAALTTDAGRKPFSMSYGGLSSADYIRYRMSRGMR
jgi:hypothetical protein